MTYLNALLLSTMMFLLTSCTIMTQEVTVVDSFKVERYLGNWFEIARLDHSFERGLTNVSAQYTQDGDTILVLNKGFNPKTQSWKEANGRAEFMGAATVARLKVSFFRPFYGAYQVHDLIEDEKGQYQAALILGPDNSYAWILARTVAISDSERQRFIDKLKRLNVDPNALIWVEHNPTLNDSNVNR